MSSRPGASPSGPRITARRRTTPRRCRMRRPLREPLPRRGNRSRVPGAPPLRRTRVVPAAAPYARRVPPVERSVTVRVPAKVNLRLAVGPRRPDGFHDLVTVFHAVSLHDEVAVRAANELAITVSGPDANQ